MVHNGIEYGLMAAYAEGLNLLRPRRARGFDLAAIAGRGGAAGVVGSGCSTWPRTRWRATRR
jgi:6-phosphogluconate dehydrogenase (decarboxylating)